jgi:hypothetical protein
MMIKRVHFVKDIAKEHILGGDNPNILSNLYVNEICLICEEDLEDGTIILKGIREYQVICEQCAYHLSSDYEGQL